MSVPHGQCKESRALHASTALTLMSAVHYMTLTIIILNFQMLIHPIVDMHVVHYKIQYKWHDITVQQCCLTYLVKIGVRQCSLLSKLQHRLIHCKLTLAPGCTSRQIAVLCHTAACSNSACSAVEKYGNIVLHLSISAAIA